MKNTSKLNGIWKRTIIGTMMLLLCACSALQIDVDVYKGPMSNHEDIQLQQYAALATSAKPIIVALRNSYIFGGQSYASYSKDMNDLDRECLSSNEQDKDDYTGCRLQLDIAFFLNSILALYEDKKDIQKKDSHTHKSSAQKILEERIKTRKIQPLRQNHGTTPGVERDNDARDERGIDRLTKEFIDATNKASEEPNEKTRKNVRIAKERLNESLIIFAEKVLFTVNNHDLASGNSTNGTNSTTGDEAVKQSFAKRFAVLQSLGNTLIVHADDLRKRATHDQRLEDRKDSELVAAQLAFTPGAQNAFDNLIRDLEAAIKQKDNEQTRLQSAKDTFDKTNTEESIKVLQSGLIEDAKKVQPRLDAYRTAFGNYDLEIDSNIAVDSKATEDQRAIASLFKQPDGKVETVLTKLKTWFDASKITPQGSLPPPSPEYARRKNAIDHLNKLSIADLNIADGTEKDMFEKLGQTLLIGLNEDNPKLEKRQRAIATAQQALDKFTKENSELIDVMKTKSIYVSVLSTIQLIKKEVLQQAEAAKVGDLAGLRHLLLLELKKQVDAAKVPEKDNFLAASKMLTEMSIPKSFQHVGGSGIKTQRDVLDDVIAQLQHQRLQAAATTDSSTTMTRLTKALELAYEQRGGLAYLRPASAYLRNAFSNTSVQDGNDTLNNLLQPSFIVSDKGLDKASRDTKLEIDKQYWQTINTIKIRGGGATDFAIVKDDVGNWYVKGISSDPESIIKSAQGLMLFNTGAKFNVNLLAQMEDQRALARKDSNLTEAERTQLRKNIATRQTGSGANTSALGKLHTRYFDEYVLTTSNDVDNLDKTLTGLTASIQAAWDKIDFGDDKVTSIAALNNDLSKPAEEIILAQAELKKAKDATAAVAAPPAVLAAKPVDPVSLSANAIIAALRQARNLRTRVATAILQNDALIKSQQGAFDLAKTKAQAQANLVEAAETKRDVAAARQQTIQDLAKSLPTPDATVSAELSKAINDTTTAETELADKKKDLKPLIEDTANKEELLAKARANRTKAAQSVTILIDGMIETITASRIDAVKTYETAISFIGETAGAQ